MKAAIALLADFPTQNFARRMVFEMSRNANLEFFGSLLPAHVSLKQPFVFDDMARLESWFDSFAARIAPFDISLDSVYYSAWEGYSILGLQVVETPILRNLHNQINSELTEFIANHSAPHDGAEHLALFYYADGPIRSGSFILYRAMPLTMLNNRSEG